MASPNAMACMIWFGTKFNERMESAMLREKQLKKWPRVEKVRLIEQSHSGWCDLWRDLVSPSLGPGFRQSLPE